MKKLIIYMALALLAAGSAVSAQKNNIELEDIWTRRTFAPKGIGSLRSMSDGEHYCTMSRTGIAKYSYATGEKVEDICLFGGPDVKKSAKPLPIFNSYRFSDDERKILLSAEFEPIYRRSGISSYWLYDIGSKQFTCLTLNGKQRLTTLSPDGTKAAFVRDNNLFWMDLATLEEHAITTDGRPNRIIYGTTDWVYEEEFAITQGFQWSPDSRRIAFYRFDETAVKEYDMQLWGTGNIEGSDVPSSRLYPTLHRFKYPKAGEDNSKLQLMLFDLPSSKLCTLPTGHWEYLPRFQWTLDPDLLAVMRMNRLQNHMEIICINADNMQLSKLYEEECPTYVDVPDTWTFVLASKKSNRQLMLLTSERDGNRHIYLYGMDGKIVRQVTSGGWEVADVCGIDAANGRIYYTSHESGAPNTDLYAVDFNGRHKQCLCMGVDELQRTTADRPAAPAFAVRDGKYVLGAYGATFSNGCKYYIRTFSDANHAPLYTLHNAKGDLIKVLEDNAALQQRMADYGTGRKSFGTLTTRRGIDLNYYTILPPDFDSTQPHPLFFFVYGGPGSQQVNNAYGGADYYWFHLLAQRGYVVACFDGRGTGGRGADFKKQTYRDLGNMECQDAIDAAAWFASKPWIASDRIGIFGWSFGGYLSTLAILKGNDVFKSAIAVAPVTNWRFYDNIYTERFLGLPADNPDGYDNNSPLNFADSLQGNYLLVHGTGDDNVHFQNSTELIDRLERAGKQFDMRIYPNKNHSIFDASGQTRLNLYRLMTDFILHKL